MKHFHLRALAPLMMLALALCWNSFAHAKDTAAQAANRRAIVAAYAQMDRALMNKDVASAMVPVADDYQGYDVTRASSGRAQMERELRLLTMRGLQIPLSKTTVSKIQWRGPDAIVWCSSLVRLRGPGGTVEMSDTSREYWGKTARGWQIRQSVQLSARVVKDGNVIFDSNK